jgi:hypothetical protein
MNGRRVAQGSGSPVRISCHNVFGHHIRVAVRGGLFKTRMIVTAVTSFY